MLPGVFTQVWYDTQNYTNVKILYLKVYIFVFDHYIIVYRQHQNWNIYYIANILRIVYIAIKLFGKVE